MADQLKQCGPTEHGDECACGCTAAGHWCGKPRCIFTHWGGKQSHIRAAQNTLEHSSELREVQLPAGSNEGSHETNDLT